LESEWRWERLGVAIWDAKVLAGSDEECDFLSCSRAWACGGVMEVKRTAWNGIFALRKRMIHVQ
jgi:hypothetical protein